MTISKNTKTVLSPEERELHHHMHNALSNSDSFKKKYGDKWKHVANGIAHCHVKATINKEKRR